MVFFFDLDGPILDISEKYYRAYYEALTALGGEPLPQHEYWELKRKRTPDSDILAKTAAGSMLGEFRTGRDGLIESPRLLGSDRVWSELRATYGRLFAATPAVLVTLRTHSDRVTWQLEQLGIKGWFREVLARPVPTNGPERWQVKEAMVRESGGLTKGDEKNCVFVGDTETDIAAGKALGMKTIAVSFGIRTRDLLAQLEPDLLFDNPVGLSAHLEEAYL